MNRVRRLAISLLLVSCLGTSCKRADAPKEDMAVPDEMVLYSLDASSGSKADNSPKDTEEFNGWRVVGKAEVKDSKDRRAIIGAVKKDIEKPDEEAKCFDPHHGIRVVENGKTVDYVICFSCHGYEVINDGKPERFSWGSTRAFGHTSEEILNRILTQAGVLLYVGGQR